MPVLSELQRAGFAGIEYPVREIDVTGGMREKTHLYPHTPGGAPEKLERLPYLIRMVAPLSQNIRGYPLQLFPETEGILRNTFDTGATHDLIVPTIGVIRAFATEWKHLARWDRMLDGVMLEVTFKEDSPNLFLVDSLIAASTPALQGPMDVMQEQGFELEEPDLFESLQNLVNDITGLQDQLELQQQLIETKALQLANMCDQISETVDFFQDPLNSETFDALKELWAAALKLHLNAAKSSDPIIEYVLPKKMHISEVAQSIYGANDRAAEILKMNPIQDAFAIPGGTVLRAFAPAA